MKTPYSKLVDLAQKHGFSTGVNYVGRQPRIAAYTQFPISLWFEPLKAPAVFAYLYFRTNSWQIDGERTDWHDVVSTLLAVYLRLGIDVSCSIWDQSNQWGLPAELYGRYITLDQPNGSVFPLSDEGLKDIEKLLSNIGLFGFLFPNFLSWSHEGGTDSEDDCKERGTYSADDDEVALWKARISTAVRENESDEVVANFRRHPDWKYYRNLSKGISVVEAPRPSSMFSTFIRSMTAKSIESITAARGDFLVTGEVKNFVSKSAKKRARELVAKLYPGDELRYLPTENMLLTFTESAILALRRDCGVNAFNREKQTIKPRHEAEARLLFPPATFDWAEQIDDDAFESMILELLTVEPGVVRARRTGSSRDADQGRDLIIDWKTRPIGSRTERNVEKEEFLELRRVVGQCKASSGAIGKAEVTDIRDTVAHHDSSGYFLATSLRITSDLAAHLDALKTRSLIWTEWWTRTEIEHRLRTHSEIAARYKAIVKPRIR